MYDITENQRQQVTLIIPFTKLNVVIETKIENNSILQAVKTNMMHCYIKLNKCLFVAQEMKNYVPNNNAEMNKMWIDVNND